MLYNFIVKNGNEDIEMDRKYLFRGEEVELIPPDWTLHQVFVHAGIYKDMDEAKSRWFLPDIPKGLRYFNVGYPLVKVKILNPIPLPARLRD